MKLVKLYLLVVIATFLLISIFGCPSGSHSVIPDMTGVAVAPSIQYAQGYMNGGAATKPLLGDLYVAIGTNPERLVLVAHGGAFKEGSRAAKEIRWLCANLARAGYAVFSIDYRLRIDKAPEPNGWDISGRLQGAHAATVDLVQALRWAKSEGYTRVFCVGESAGGVAIVQACAAPSDYLIDDIGFADLNDTLPDPAPVDGIGLLWSGTGQGIITAVFPPTVILHGTSDMTVGASVFDATSLGTQLTMLGVSHNLILLPGYEHGAWTAGTEYGTIADAVINWFDGR